MPAALVFGARNLGRAIARHLADGGWEIAAFALTDRSLQRLASEVEGALTIRGDARDDADVARAFATTRERFGSVDLVAVAISPSTQQGVAGSAILDAPRDALARYTDDLLPALFTLLRHGSRVLTEQGGGTYVQITGGSARRGMAGRAPWAAAAAASRAMIQSAAAELRDANVQVALLIVDAIIESDKTRDALASRDPADSASEQDVAEAVAYLAAQSPRAWTHELQITPSGDRWVP